MLLKTKKGLLKQKPLPIKCVYKKQRHNQNDYSVIIYKFTNNQTIRDLLFDYIKGLSFVIKSNQLKKQLNLLENLTLDEQIFILNKTIEKGWGSINFEYENLIKGRKL